MPLITEQLPHSRLGTSAEALAFVTRAENRAAAITLARQTRHSLYIFTRDLEPDIYGDAEFVRAVVELIRDRRRAKIRVLVQDSTRAVKDGHRLVEVARSFPSFVEIRNPPATLTGQQYEAFLVADETGVLYRVVAGRHEGCVNFNARLEARNLVTFFREIWEQATPDPELRRLYL